MRYVRPQRAQRAAWALCQPASGFSTSLGLCLQVEGARCIREQQWRPWFRRSKLYSLMAATRRPDPGVAIKTFCPLEPRTLLRPNFSTFFSSLVADINRQASPQCVRSRGWEPDGAGGRREAVLPSSSRFKLSAPRFHSCKSAKAEAGFLHPGLSLLPQVGRVCREGWQSDLVEVDIC